MNFTDQHRDRFLALLDTLIDLKRTQDIIDYARKEYVLIRRIAIMTSAITLVVVVFRVWAYVFRGA